MDTIAIPDLQSDPASIKPCQSDSNIVSGSETDPEDYPGLFVCINTDIDDDELESDSPRSEDPPMRSPNKVHFRSRVRITSGINRHRHTVPRSSEDYYTLSRSSSMSGSASSSISAPLRNMEEDATGKPTLGQRIAIMAQAHAQRKARRREQRELDLFAKSVHLGINLPNGYGADERTPLRGTCFVMEHSSSPADTSDAAELLARDIDLVFGPWPTRLWNHRWWMWHIEPIICCHCLTEADDEHY